MVAETILPAWPVVFATAAVDAVNPCAIGVLVLLIATLLSFSKDKKKMLLVGGIYISAVFITYLAAGFGLLAVIQLLPPSFSIYLGYLIGAIVIVMGLLEMKDFFWYGKGISLQIPKRRAQQVMQMIKKVSVPGSVVLGIFVAAVELPCTGGPYLAITTVLAKIGIGPRVVWLLVVYNFIFVLPLIIILLLVFFGVKPERIKSWKESKKKWMRLVMGAVMTILGVLLILFANGTIHFSIA